MSSGLLVWQCPQEGDLLQIPNSVMLIVNSRYHQQGTPKVEEAPYSFTQEPLSALADALFALQGNDSGSDLTIVPATAVPQFGV